MKHLSWLLIFAVFWAVGSAAEEVGRQLNWQTLGAANYVDQTLPTAQEGEETGEGLILPKLIDESGAGVESTRSNLSQSATVFVNSIELQGATVFSAAELEAIVAPYLDRQVSMEELQDLRLALSQSYLSRGYVNSGVIIPDQDIAEGRIVLQAIEGTLARVEIEGNPKLADRYIRGRLARRIEQPLDIEEIKEALQNLQRDRNVSWVDARLVPGDELGVGVLRVKVQEPPHFEVGLSADNHHSSSAGAERGRLYFRSSNPAGSRVDPSVYRYAQKYVFGHIGV